MELKEDAEGDKQLIKRKVGCRRALAKQISMVLKMDVSMTEVASIIPTLEGALFNVLVYRFNIDDSSSSLEKPLLASQMEESYSLEDLLSNAISDGRLLQGIQNAFGLEYLPERVSFSSKPARQATSIEFPESVGN